MEFPTKIDDIIKQFSLIKPELYAKSRNFRDGAVTRLGPYISRGVISTRQVCEYITSLKIPWYQVEKFFQELAWRDYWQQIWLIKGEKIDTDLKNRQHPICSFQIPKAIVEASTGINEVDKAIEGLYNSGYMHNHMRMYVASICCNIAKSHWLEPSKWLYANLLDGDVASNQLSWQWVAGTFSSKKYYANQDNINYFFSSPQKKTFLDIDYALLREMQIPEILRETIILKTKLNLPKINTLQNLENRESLIYNYYNLDPFWHKEKEIQRILLLEPSVFKKHPVSQKCLDFALELSHNISNVKIHVGEFEELLNYLDPKKIYFKEHPLNRNYKGYEEPRDWLTEVTGYFSSFFSFWKKCKKELIQKNK